MVIVFQELFLMDIQCTHRKVQEACEQHRSSTQLTKSLAACPGLFGLGFIHSTLHTTSTRNHFESKFGEWSHRRYYCCTLFVFLGCMRKTKCAIPVIGSMSAVLRYLWLVGCFPGLPERSLLPTAAHTAHSYNTPETRKHKGNTNQ